MTFDPRRQVVVIVAAVESGPNLVERVRAFHFQVQVQGRGRLIVVDGTRDQTLVAKASTFPVGITIIASEPDTLAPELWGQGIRQSTEPIFVLTTSIMMPRPGWLDAGVDRLMESGCAGVGGPIEPADWSRPLDRAVYLLRYLNYATPLYKSANPDPPGDNAFYRREMLGWIKGGFWESEIHRELRARGLLLCLDPDAVVEFHGGSTFTTMLRQRFLHAWHYGSGRSRRFGPGQKLGRSVLAPMVPGLLAARIFRTLLEKRLPLGRWLPAFPWLLPLLLAWTLGELVGVWISPRDLCPEEAAEDSPGQRPGFAKTLKIPSPERARHRPRDLAGRFRPFRAHAEFFRPLIRPRALPWAILSRPFSAKRFAREAFAIDGSRLRDEPLETTPWNPL